MKKIYFITWASWVWKTTLVSELEKKYKDKFIFLHFDSIWVPSYEDMVRDFWSWENWQKETTNKWINILINNYNSSQIIIFEWQVNLKFIKDWFNQNNFSDYKIILIDCNEETMEKRLIERKQKELFTDDMKNWLNYLRNQAKEFNAKVIDTSYMGKEKVIETFENIL